MKTVLLLGQSNELRDAIVRRGHDVVVMDADTLQPLQLCDQLVALHATVKFEAIVPACEAARIPASMAAAKLALRAPALTTVLNATDRGRMRTILHSAGMSQLLFRKCATLGEAAEFLLGNGGPIAIYDADGVAHRVATSSDLRTVWQQVAGRAGVICEEWVDGTRVTVEGFTANGVFTGAAVTGHTPNGAHQPAVGVSPYLRDSLFAMTARIVALFGTANGVSHTTYKLTDRGPIFLDSVTHADRFVGALTRLTSGIDLADAAVALALGEPIAAKPAWNSAAAVRFVHATPGIVTYVDVPEIDPEAGIAEAAAFVAEGEIVEAGKLAYVIATDARAEHAMRRAKAFAHAIEILIEEMHEEMHEEMEEGSCVAIAS